MEARYSSEALRERRLLAPSEKAQALAAAQRAWLAERDHNCSCEMIPECVREAYRNRLAERSAEAGGSPPARDQPR